MSPLRRLAAGLAAVAVVASGLTATVLTDDPASAAPARVPTTAELLAQFDPSDIISDEVMYNPSTMTAPAIQTFLEGKVPTCKPGYTCLKDYVQDTTSRAADPMCGAYTGKQAETAAEIVKRVATACGVNPQVLLVTLQKEQSLVTDTWPGARQYRSATGYGCPDTAPCDSDYYGFFNQVYKAAWAFKRYTMPKGTGPGTSWSTVYNWFPVGRRTGVLFNPTAACGAGTISIQNKATATLYYFTPYQPNTSALSAGWGIGDSCSAYGNRNFFLYFSSWFGSTHYAVTGDVATLWRSLGGAQSAVGNPAENAVAVTDAGGGTSQRFSNGAIFSSAAGTFAVTGAVLKDYTASGGPAGPLGWPRKAVVTRKENGGGLIQAFQKGSVYSSSAGAFAVAGAVYTRYSKASFQGGALGWPTADAVASTAAGGGSWQTFSGGRIYAGGGATTIVTGDVLTKYLARGAEGGSLGWPAADAATVTVTTPKTATAKSVRSKGVVQPFRGGAVVVTTKAYTVTGDIAKRWTASGGATGSLGWPTSVAKRSAANGGGWYQRFTGGRILWSAASGAHPLKGAELALYQARGGVAGSLGWPSAPVREKAGTGGWVTTFTNGRVYRSKAGTYPVLGAILERYLAKQGPAGTLGWPIGTAGRQKGVLVQRFEHGSISYTAEGGAKATRS